jgi:exopolysaccharide biosynthesis predicted pyruvyltransferase EpsI
MLVEFLKKYVDKDIIYIPNPGNAGDSLIAYGTITLFKKIGLNYKIGEINKKYDNEILFYGCGGNFVGLYNNCKNFLKLNKDNNEIVILPHTIQNEDSILKELNENVIIFCREQMSFDYVFSLIKYKHNLFLSNDMAFYIDLNFIDYNKGDGESNNFRLDCEKTKIAIPKDNNDLSNTLNKHNNTTDEKVIEEISKSLFFYLNKFEIVNTNRLHVAICASLLNKKVNFHANSYYKNKAVYDFSIKNNYPNTLFIDNE